MKLVLIWVDTSEAASPVISEESAFFFSFTYRSISTGVAPGERKVIIFWLKSAGSTIAA